MPYRIILKVQDSNPKLEYISHDYCIPVINRMIDQISSTSKDQRSSNYSDDKKKILKMCAPDEIEFSEYFDDIIKYYEKYFKTGETEEQREITVMAVFHKYTNSYSAYAVGSNITIPFFNVINDLISFNEWRISDDKEHTKEYQIVEKWKNNTKQIFSNQLRYVMAHEMYHVLQGFELEKARISSNNKLDIVNEILAEYFALAYINDYCNGTGANYCNTTVSEVYGTLDLRGKAYFTEEDKKDGIISRQMIYSASMFDRTSKDNRDLCDRDYNGGAFLLALAIVHKCKSFGNQDPFYTELNAMVMENRADDALEKIVSRQDESRKWLEIILRGNKNYYKEEENC